MMRKNVRSFHCRGFFIHEWMDTEQISEFEVNATPYTGNGLWFESLDAAIAFIKAKTK